MIPALGIALTEPQEASDTSEQTADLSLDRSEIGLHGG